MAELKSGTIKIRHNLLQISEIGGLYIKDMVDGSYIGFYQEDIENLLTALIDLFPEMYLKVSEDTGRLATKPAKHFENGVPFSPEDFPGYMHPGESFPGHTKLIAAVEENRVRIEELEKLVGKRNKYEYITPDGKKEEIWLSAHEVHTRNTASMAWDKVRELEDWCARIEAKSDTTYKATEEIAQWLHEVFGYPEQYNGEDDVAEAIKIVLKQNSTLAPFSGNTEVVEEG
jgi:hypothetical protein